MAVFAVVLGVLAGGLTACANSADVDRNAGAESGSGELLYPGTAMRAAGAEVGGVLSTIYSLYKAGSSCYYNVQMDRPCTNSELQDILALTDDLYAFEAAAQKDFEQVEAQLSTIIKQQKQSAVAQAYAPIRNFVTGLRLPGRC